MRTAVTTLAFVSLLVAACDKVAEPEASPKPSAAATNSAAADPTELIKEDLKVGEGERTVKDGDAINVNYVGKLLKNGSKFDENTSKDKPFPFTVGEGVIDGWSQGVIGMKKGGKRKLTIPSRLAYGEKGSGKKIPPNAALTFEIDLLGWADEPAAAPSGSASAGPSPSASASAAPAASASASPAAGSAAAPKPPKPDAKKDAPKPESK